MLNKVLVGIFIGSVVTGLAAMALRCPLVDYVFSGCVLVACAAGVALHVRL